MKHISTPQSPTPGLDIVKDWRFERSLRLFGQSAMDDLARCHIAVFGLGGVGSYAAEALARSGVGNLTLVEFDQVCITNINRQLHATTGTIGANKVDVIAARMRDINPRIHVRVCNEFYDRHTSAHLLEPRPDVVIDCIDNVTAKMHLVATCVESEIPIVTTLGAGAKLDPTRIRVAPLPATHSDPLGRALRKYIRRKHKISEQHLARVIAVFSDEPVMLPITDHGGVVCGVDCVCPNRDNTRHTCKQRHVIYGSAMFVTAAFGLAAVSAAIRLHLGRDPLSPPLECPACGTPVDSTRPRRAVTKAGKKECQQSGRSDDAGVSPEITAEDGPTGP